MATSTALEGALDPSQIHVWGRPISQQQGSSAQSTGQGGFGDMPNLPSYGASQTQQKQPQQPQSGFGAFDTGGGIGDQPSARAGQPISATQPEQSSQQTSMQPDLLSGQGFGGNVDVGTPEQPSTFGQATTPPFAAQGKGFESGRASSQDTWDTIPDLEKIVQEEMHTIERFGEQVRDVVQHKEQELQQLRNKVQELTYALSQAQQQVRQAQNEARENQAKWELERENEKRLADALLRTQQQKAQAHHSDRERVLADQIRHWRAQFDQGGERIKTLQEHLKQAQALQQNMDAMRDYINGTNGVLRQIEQTIKDMADDFGELGDTAWKRAFEDAIDDVRYALESQQKNASSRDAVLAQKDQEMRQFENEMNTRLQDLIQQLEEVSNQNESLHTQLADMEEEMQKVHGSAQNEAKLRAEAYQTMKKLIGDSRQVKDSLEEYRNFWKDVTPLELQPETRQSMQEQIGKWMEMVAERELDELRRDFEKRFFSPAEAIAPEGQEGQGWEGQPTVPQSLEQEKAGRQELGGGAPGEQMQPSQVGEGGWGQPAQPQKQAQPTAGGQEIRAKPSYEGQQQPSERQSIGGPDITETMRPQEQQPLPGAQGIQQEGKQPPSTEGMLPSPQSLESKGLGQAPQQGMPQPGARIPQISPEAQMGAPQPQAQAPKPQEMKESVESLLQPQKPEAPPTLTQEQKEPQPITTQEQMKMKIKTPEEPLKPSARKQGKEALKQKQEAPLYRPAARRSTRRPTTTYQGGRRLRELEADRPWEDTRFGAR